MNADMKKLVERLRERADEIPQEIADRENEAAGNCGPYGKQKAAEFLDDYDRLLMLEAITENTRLTAELAEARAALANIRWRSADRDNMEFAATITYSQMDAIRAALKGPTHG